MNAHSHGTIDTFDQTEHAPVEDTGARADGSDEDLLIEELLVEEISIDGMCGVY